ncbi:MAG: decaprenyl-phosphate phosphoribosyltransferase, partial [Fimbriimonadaceae bacterium]|nr:decaprenyl-phosphate phosphoribosyltransferase [Fimbriimonadaceae bacterium]
MKSIAPEAEAAPLDASKPRRPMLLQVLRLMRPKQWTKNLLVFAAPLFTGSIGDIQKLTPALLAFASLCLASSTIYVVNDLLDVERDRQHPKKRYRPLASGTIPKGLA